MDTKKLLLMGGLGIVTIVGFLQLQKLNQPAPVQQTVATPEPQIISQVDYIDVLAIAVDVSMGQRLTPEMMMWKKWPTEAMSESFIDITTRPQAMEELTSSVVKVPLYAGEPIVQRKVVLKNDRSAMASMLQPGMRAIATRISVDSAAGGFINPNDRVDIVLTTQQRETATPGMQAAAATTYAATTIFENVKVLAVDQVYGNSADGQAFVIGSTATLEMSQEDAEVLIEAQSKGELSLTLRGLDSRRPGFVPSAATTKREEKSASASSITMYRNGQSQQVSVQGQ